MSKVSPQEGSLKDQAAVHDQVTKAVLEQFEIMKQNIESGAAPIEQAYLLLNGLYTQKLLENPAFAEYVGYFYQKLVKAGGENFDMEQMKAIKASVVENMKEDHCDTSWIEEVPDVPAATTDDGAAGAAGAAAAAAPTTGAGYSADEEDDGAGAGGSGFGMSEAAAADAAAAELDSTTAAMGEMTLAGADSADSAGADGGAA